MQIMSFTQYKNWRSSVLKSPNSLPHTIHTSRRGEYRQWESVCVTGDCSDDDDDDVLDVSVEGLAIAKFYTELYWSGLINDWTMCRKFYSEDEDMFHSYVGIKAQRLKDKDGSRNNIIHSDANCLTLWQFTNGTLTVYSRSSDLRRAGLTDCIAIRNIAKRLNAKTWQWFNNSPHDYTSIEKIARRNCG